jgi:hypothetical protein
MGLVECSLLNARCSDRRSTTVIALAGCQSPPSSLRAGGACTDGTRPINFLTGPLADYPKSSKLANSIIQTLSQGMTRRFRTVLSIAMLGFIVSMADITAALSRPDTTRMTCAAARALVMRHGGIVLGTGPSLFDRFVSSRAYCMSTEVTEPAFVPTADDRECFIGYTCREPNYGWD